jgi:Lrp/AsnC family transcriptional regulator, regulator for asnA, asnC and gidA
MYDSLDVKIMRILQKDAQIPFSEIAKTLGVSSSLVQIRFNRLKKTGVILGTTLILDPEKFGSPFQVSIGVKAFESEIDEVTEFMNNTLSSSESKVLAWPMSGRYNIYANVFSKNLLEVHKIRQAIKGHPHVIDVGISVNLTQFYGSDYSLNLERKMKR